MKKCSDCGLEKALSEFSKHKGSKDGLRSYCRECNKIRTAIWIARYQAKNKGRDPYDETDKACSRCREVFPRIKKWWTPEPSRLDGLGNKCLDCMKLAVLKSNAKKRGEVLNLPTPFTGKEMRALKEKQKYKCYVCKIKENGKRLSLDHNHRTGKIRGYAHDHCNVGLLRWLDELWHSHPEKREWLKSNPFFYEILFNPPAKFLYETKTPQLSGYNDSLVVPMAFA